MSSASLLFVCTGNLCRSPSAAWFLAQRLRAAGHADVAVRSVGTIQTVGPPPEHLLVEGEAYGLDLRGHTPRQMVPDDVTGADLIIGMTRQHVREVMLMDRGAFARAFTLREFVRRADDAGPRQVDGALVEWLGQVSGGRRHLDLVGESTDDDIPDPMGGPPEGYRSMLADVERLIESLYALMWNATRDTESTG